VFENFKLPFRKKAESTAPEPLRELTGSKTSVRLSGVPRMAERFPSVRHMAVNLVISPPHNETEPTMNGRSFGPQALAFFEFRCKNVECRDGGFDITDSIEKAVTNGDSDATGRRVCRGYQGKTRTQHLRCHYELNFRINIAYDED
jgi:hypothetical protein